MALRPLMIGFGGHAIIEANHFRRQRLIEMQCARTGKEPGEAEAALLAMTPSDLALMELTGSPDHPGVHEFEYDPYKDR
jgi:hypothetical protein